METKDIKEPLSFVIDNLKYRVLSEEDKTVEVMATTIRYKLTNFDYETVQGKPYFKGFLRIPSHVESQGVKYCVIAIADRAFENHSVLIYDQDYKGEVCDGIGNVSIPSTVRKIGARAFCNCFSLNHINIPAGVEIIGDEAFMGCFNSWDPWIEPPFSSFAGLQYVIIEDNKDDLNINGSIGERAFANCPLIEEIIIPGRFKTIGLGAFSKCGRYHHYSWGKIILKYGLNKVIFHEGVKNIGPNVFEYCDALKSFNLPSSIEEIDESLFEYSYNSVEKHFWEESLNENGKTQSLIIPWHIRKINDKGCFYTFDYNMEIVKSYVDNPADIEIGDVFGYKGCFKLKVLPGCVEKYKASKFWSDFESIEELGSTERLSFAVDGLRYIVLSYSKKTVEVMSSYIPIERYGEKVDDIDLPLEDVVIPDVVDYEGIAYKVTKISTHGFVNHANLKSLSISRNVKSIGDYAFYQCNKLKSIVIPAGVTNIGEYAFAELGSASIQIEEKHTDDDEYCTINPYAFENSGRGDLTIPSQVKIICDYAFHKNHFNSVKIESDDVLIAENAFFS